MKDPDFEYVNLTEIGAEVSGVDNLQPPQISSTESKAGLRSLMMTADGSAAGISKVEYAFDWSTL